MYEIIAETSFSAAHHLRDYQGSCERVHGHNWLVRAFVQCEQLNELGLGIDFRDLRAHLREAVAPLDHADLNEAFTGAKGNPSSENIARHLFDTLSKRINDGRCRIARVEVQETPGSCAAYFE
ncbi:MAG: 6-carboxytetrahydropterin synthase QueD [Chitinivibrionales bacterium]|nr:6-carboxytetrahydropterin synthase QueD [Chitinivibrionales bacterium]